jgi:hypothetical protein
MVAFLLSFVFHRCLWLLGYTAVVAVPANAHTKVIVGVWHPAPLSISDRARGSRWNCSCSLPRQQPLPAGTKSCWR